MADRIWIYDSTLFAGDRAPGHALKPEDKARMAERLDQMGVDVIEAGMPADGMVAVESIRRVAGVLHSAILSVYCRTLPQDIADAAALVNPCAVPD